LSVLLFYLFVNHHPLEGERELAIRCMDLPAMAKLYGIDPVFIFDPRNDTNRPVPGYHDNALALWPIYPRFFQDMFIRAFGGGLHDPAHDRVRESEWRSAMMRLYDSVLLCTSCGSENFYDMERLRGTGSAGQCWSCGRPLQLPPRIRLESDSRDSLVMLYLDTQLYPHHVESHGEYGFQRPVAQVRQHPRRPEIWGLQNLAEVPWVVTAPDGTVRSVPPGSHAAIRDGLQIQFGQTTGVIRL
jgi:hypothetical protein